LSLPQFRETGSARPPIGMLMSSSIGSIRVGAGKAKSRSRIFRRKALGDQLLEIGVLVNREDLGDARQPRPAGSRRGRVFKDRNRPAW
jgi:hypothetical protein